MSFVIGVPSKYLHLYDIPSDVHVLNIDTSTLQSSESVPGPPKQLHNLLEKRLKALLASSNIKRHADMVGVDYAFNYSAAGMEGDGEGVEPLSNEDVRPQRIPTSKPF
jgi:hypothetical protein